MTQAATSTRAWTEMKPSGKGSVPEGLWMRCPGCAALADESRTCTPTPYNIKIRKQVER